MPKQERDRDPLMEIGPQHRADRDDKLMDQMSRLLQEVFNDAGIYPWKDMEEEEVIRMQNQFDRRYSIMMGG